MVKDAGGDEGMSLIETIMALAVVATTMAAMGPFFTRSLQGVSDQRSQQAAVAVANTAIEQVRALKGSSLLAKRGRDKSTTQWNAAPVAIKAGYLNNTQLVWDETIKDAASTLGDEAPLPTTSRTVTVEGISYSRTIYVGGCVVYVTRSDAGTTNCVNPATVAPPKDVLQTLRFFRVVVAVTWPGRRDCQCSFVTSTLVARDPEPTFDFHRPAPLITTREVTFYRGVSNTYELKATGGTLPNTWAATPLPPGLSIAGTTGIISGTPTGNVTNMASQVTVSDKQGRSDTETLYFTVVNPPALTAPASAASLVGEAVNQQLTTTGGVSPFTYTATGLPPGLNLNADTGAITGTATTVGTYSVTVTSTDANPTPSVSTVSTASRTYTHTVYPALTLAPIANQTVTMVTAFSATASASGGNGTYTYSATGLPAGIVLNAGTGAMSGLATISGRYLPTVTVTDGLGRTASTSFAIVINTTGLIFTSPALTAADRTSVRGAPTTATFQTNGALLGLSPTITATGLPPGLTFNPLTGSISGTPTTAGVYKVTVLAVSLLPPQTSNLTFLWTIT